MNLEYQHENPGGAHKYSDLWRADWREDIDWLAAEQKSTCQLCGHEMTGTARELILAFREHRKTVHGQRVPDLKKKAEERLLMLDSQERVNSAGVASRRNAVVNSAVSNKKHTLVKMIERRDMFRLENGRDPVRRDMGFSSGSFTKNVMELFGGWRGFLDYEVDGAVESD